MWTENFTSFWCHSRARKECEKRKRNFLLITLNTFKRFMIRLSARQKVSVFFLCFILFPAIACSQLLTVHFIWNICVVNDQFEVRNYFLWMGWTKAIFRAPRLIRAVPKYEFLSYSLKISHISSNWHKKLPKSKGNLKLVSRATRDTLG